MYGSKFHRRYGHLLSAPGLLPASQVIQPRSIITAPAGPPPRPRFDASNLTAVEVGPLPPLPGGGNVSFWDKETLGIENRIAVPVGITLTGLAIYALTR